MIPFARLTGNLRGFYVAGGAGSVLQVESDDLWLNLDTVWGDCRMGPEDVEVEVDEGEWDRIHSLPITWQNAPLFGDGTTDEWEVYADSGHFPEPGGAG